MSGIVRARLRALSNRYFTPAITTARRIGCALAATAALILLVPGIAHADPGAAFLAVNTLPQVIANLQKLIVGFLFSVGTLFGAWAGLLWATAGGDPAQVERAKGAAKNAGIGYGLGVLAPVLLQVVRGIVGG